MHTEPEPIAAEQVITDIEHDPARRQRAAEQSVDALSQGEDARRQAQFFEHGKAGRLQDQPRPKRPRLVELIENGDPMPIATEKERRRKAGRTGPGDRDRERLHRRIP